MTPLLVVTGPPGAGKSTVAQLLAQAAAGPSVHLRADDFWGYLVAGFVPPWLPESTRQNAVVLRAVVAACATFGTGGYAVVLDGVLGPWFVDLLRTELPAESSVDYVILLPSLPAATGRVRARTGHALTDLDVVAQMHREFSATVGPYARHVLDTSALSADATAAAVLTGCRLGAFRLP